VTFPLAVHRLLLMGALLFTALASPEVPGATTQTNRSNRGYQYIHDSDPEVPWSIHIVRVRRNHPNLRFETTLGQTNSFGMALISDQARWTVSESAQPVAAINGDFYTNEDAYPARPRDLQIRNGEMLTDPDGHACFWMDPDGQPHRASVTSRLRFIWHDGTEVEMGLNERRSTDTAVLFTPAVGTSTRTRGGTELILEPSPDSPALPLKPGQRYSTLIREVRTGGNTPTRASQLVLSLGPRLASRLAKASPGLSVTVFTETTPNLAGVQTALGGGPTLVANGVAMKWSGINLRHPRSAIGWSDEFVFLVEVDGRQGNLSVGMSFPELAGYMLKLGCTEAMNLDGGGSATLWVLGNVINSPSEGRERPAANALVLTEIRSDAPNREDRVDGPQTRLMDSTRRSSPEDPAQKLFSPEAFLELDFRVESQHIAQLHQQPRQAVPAELRSRFRSTAAMPWIRADHTARIRLKGSTGSFRPIDDKPSLTVDFLQDNDLGQPWHGLHRIYLNNSVEDPSLLHERLGSEIFLAHGIPAQRVAHARIRLNGRNLGVYVLKEAFTEAFIARHFGQPTGELYDNDDGPDLDHPLHRNLPDLTPLLPAADTALKTLSEAVNESDPDRRWQRVSSLIDSDRFLTFASLEVMLGHRDGYGLARNNFRLYRDPASNRWTFLPDGMDQLFGLASFPWRPQMSGLVARALLDSHEGRQLYTRRFLELLDSVFLRTSPATRVGQLAAALRPHLQAEERGIFDPEVASLQKRILDREQNLRTQVAAEAPPSP